MDVNTFIAEFNKSNTASDKKVLIKKHIVNQYVPFELKTAIARKIVDLMYVDGAFIINNTTRIMFEKLLMLSNYSDIEIDFKNALAEYNELQKINVFEMAQEHVNGAELAEFRRVIATTIDDAWDNSQSIVGYIHRTFGNMSSLLDAVTKNTEVTDPDAE